MKAIASPKDIILDNERALARQAALAAIDDPQPPGSGPRGRAPRAGKAIVDFVTRGPKTRRSVERHMLPREAAMKAARGLAEEHERDEVMPVMERKIRVHAQAMDLDDEDFIAATTDLGALLADHYVRLLAVEGGDWAELLRKAYLKGGHYAAFLDDLALAEQRADKALAAAVGGDAGDRIRAQAKHREIIRRKDLATVFGA